MRCYQADLHIHSVLSPCGGLEMSPRALMRRARELGIEWIAITDHNSLANCAAYEKAAEESGLAFSWGVEIQTAEEIHLLAYFDDRQKAAEFDRELYDALPPIPNDPDFFGDQPVIDAEENIVRLETRALSSATGWDLEECLKQVNAMGGFCVPAHVDAEANSLLGQLGFIPPGLDLPVLGITARLDLERFLAGHPELAGYSFLRASDAHYLSDLGSGSARIQVSEPNVAELALAARKAGGREILL